MGQSFGYSLIAVLFPGTKLSDSVCENALLMLNCDKGKRIYISSAQYGSDQLIPQRCRSSLTDSPSGLYQG